MRQQTNAISPASRFTVGRDGKGAWIVTDARNLCGGIFSNRPAAIHYALEESGYNEADVSAAPDGTVLSLDAVFTAAPRGK